MNLDISDNGNGIPKSIQPYIFEKGITSNKNTGNGLSLSFIKEKFDESGFKINLQQSTTGHTIFKIQIPLKEIILIDDNPLVRDTWSALARKMGIKIRTYAKSKDFRYDKTDKSTPVFVDFKLEKENGLDLVQILKNSGFRNVALATGEKSQINPLVVQVGKGFPSWS